jgi:chaperonin GroEL (HSP60 family)
MIFSKNGYNSANAIAVEVLNEIYFFGEGDELSRPTRLARNIAANRKEFTDYVVKAFQDVEADNGSD